MTEFVARENAYLANEVLVLQEEKDLLLWLLAEKEYRYRQMVDLVGNTGRELDETYADLRGDIHAVEG